MRDDCRPPAMTTSQMYFIVDRATALSGRPVKILCCLPTERGVVTRHHLSSLIITRHSSLHVIIHYHSYHNDLSPSIHPPHTSHTTHHHPPPPISLHHHHTSPPFPPHHIPPPFVSCTALPHSHSPTAPLSHYPLSSDFAGSILPTGAASRHCALAWHQSLFFLRLVYPPYCRCSLQCLGGWLTHIACGVRACSRCPTVIWQYPPGESYAMRLQWWSEWG